MNKLVNSAVVVTQCVSSIEQKAFFDFVTCNFPLQSASYKYDVLSLWDLGEGATFDDCPELIFVPGCYDQEWVGKSARVKTKVAVGSFEGKKGSWYLNAKNPQELPFIKK